MCSYVLPDGNVNSNDGYSLVVVKHFASNHLWKRHIIFRCFSIGFNSVSIWLSHWIASVMISKAIFIWGPKAPWLLLIYTYITLIRDSYKCNDIYRLFNTAQHLDNSTMYHFIKLLFLDAFWLYSGLLMLDYPSFFPYISLMYRKTVIAAASLQFLIWRYI